MYILIRVLVIYICNLEYIVMLSLLF